MDANCCEKANACHDDGACAAEVDCLFRCSSDGACRARCNQFYNRVDALLDTTACREKSCAAECGLSCGGLAYSVPGCDSCVQSTCCELASACAKNVECLRLDLCRSNCLPGSMSCPTECEAQHPDGRADYAPWLNCVQNTCTSSCQAGRGWACLDAPFVWPKPQVLGTITFALTVVDLQTERPFANATVKACAKLDTMCLSPIKESTTDAEGLVSLTVPAGSVGFDGYVEITGGNNGTSPIYSAMWYPVPPIISDGWRGRLQFISAEDLPLFAIFTGVDIDPTRGHFAANATDCNFSAAGDVSFVADAQENNPEDKTIKRFYFVGGVPSISATRTDPTTSIAGFVNLPARAALITATSIQAGNKQVGQLQFNIRAGWFTTSTFPPVP